MSATKKEQVCPEPKRPPLQVMDKPTTEVKSIQRYFETAPSPKTAQLLEASENITHVLQQNSSTRQFEAQLSFVEFKREDVIITLIRSLRTVLISTTQPGTSCVVNKRIEFPPQVKYDTVKIDMTLEGQLTISAKESLVILPPATPATEAPPQSTLGSHMKSASTLRPENSFVIEQSKNLDTGLISQGATPGGATEMTQDLVTSVSEDGRIWTFELPIPDGYAPEEMSTQVTPETKTVVIVGKRWGTGAEPGKKKWLEFWRKFELPENVKPESITMSFSQDRKRLIVTAETEDRRAESRTAEAKTSPTESQADKLNTTNKMIGKRVLPPTFP